MSADEKTTQSDSGQIEPFLTVVSGSPTDEDIAALVAVFVAARDGERPQGPTVVDDWGSIAALQRHSWGMPTSFVNRG